MIILEYLIILVGEWKLNKEKLISYLSSSTGKSLSKFTGFRDREKRERL